MKQKEATQQAPLVIYYAMHNFFFKKKKINNWTEEKQGKR
jgi:hypothetical protein